MTLAAGTHIGPYEIRAPLGAGGMGEVYRARDTKLARDVALKILPDDVIHDAARVARFQREAQLLAALNHPHIAQIYGFEDSTEIRALVMELVEGPTLAEVIERRAGPSETAAKAAGLPLDEALPIARQIAEALEAAHEQGIVHRDLKPANIKVRPDGTVKVLDFGLAKLREGVGRDFSPAGSKDPAYTHSPTITSPALMTGVGVILGTAAYMAPEQARGKAVDKRADIWAFGCVLYEMLTGRRLFAADEVSDTLALVLMKEVDWTPLPAATPPAILTLLRRCLEKDRKRRLPDIGVARLEIDEALAAPVATVPHVSASRQRRPQHVAWSVAAIAALVALAVTGVHFSEAPPLTPSAIRFSVLPPAGMTIPGGEGQWLSPDGRHIAFRVTPVGTGGGGLRLAIRSFDEADARVLKGTEGVANAFWSPDSRFLGFFAAGKLQKIDVTGGPPQVLCDAPFSGFGGSTGGSWNSDGVIVFGVGGPGAGLFRVSSGGGTPVPLTKPGKDEVGHRHPWFLPDGRHFLYVATLGQGGFARHSVNVGSLDGESSVPLVQSDTKSIYANGFVLFVRDNTLLGQPFDAARLSTTGDPVVIAQNIANTIGFANGALSASVTGVLAYRTRSAGGVASQLVWHDRRGKTLGPVGDQADQTEVQLSPDGTGLAVSVLDPTRRTRDIWIHDLTRNGLRTRFTFDVGEDWASVWSPDGRSIIFSAGRPSPLDLYQKNANGSGPEKKLLEGNAAGTNKYAGSWSSDGRFLLYNIGTAGSQTGNDLWVLPLSDAQQPRPLLQTPFNEIDPRFSPDGRWVAYRSNESGRPEIYVMPFTGEQGKWQISTAGGEEPRWRRDGRELFYLAGNTIMAAEVNGSGAAFTVGAVRPLFEVRRRTTAYLGFGTGSVYDVTGDGQRFLVNVVAEEQEPPPPVTVITNWTATLR
jgi:tRNA A-37 threonylcarbamoyl transferase component Bud32